MRPAPHHPALPALAVSTDHNTKTSPNRPSPEDRLVASLISLMEAGTTPWRRPWDEESGGHHVNLLSGRPYRGTNPALLSFGLHLRGSSLPYWCGFAEAKAKGLAPRRGSQAVHVLRPQLIQAQTAQTEAVDEQGNASGAGPRRVLYRPVPVFNAVDLEGTNLAELIQARRSAAARERRPEPERLQRAEAVLEAWPVPVLRGGDRACYVPDADRIHLPSRAAFHSAAAQAATWAHEAIHSTGHPSRLGRDLSGVIGAGEASGMAYAREELVAELGAVLLGDRLEIGSDTRNHAAYLSHWITLLRDSPRLLLKLLSEARRAADLICPDLPTGDLQEAPSASTTPAGGGSTRRSRSGSGQP